MNNAEPTPDVEAWRTQRPKLAPTRPVEPIKAEPGPTVEIPYPHLQETDVQIETHVVIKGRKGVLVDEVSCATIPKALVPAGRGAFASALDRAFQAAADNVKIRFSDHVDEPVLTQNTPPTPPVAPINGGNDRRTLNPADINGILDPALPSAQPDDFPDQLPPRPEIKKTPS